MGDECGTRDKDEEDGDMVEDEGGTENESMVEDEGGTKGVVKTSCLVLLTMAARVSTIVEAGAIVFEGVVAIVVVCSI